MNDLAGSKISVSIGDGRFRALDRITIGLLGQGWRVVRDSFGPCSYVHESGAALRRVTMLHDEGPPYFCLYQDGYWCLYQNGHEPVWISNAKHARSVVSERATRKDLEELVEALSKGDEIRKRLPAIAKMTDKELESFVIGITGWEKFSVEIGTRRLRALRAFQLGEPADSPLTAIEYEYREGSGYRVSVPLKAPTEWMQTKERALVYALASNFIDLEDDRAKAIAKDMGDMGDK